MVLLAILLTSKLYAQTLSMTVARVEDHVITSREVNIGLLMEQALYSIKPTYKLEPLDSKAFFSQVNEAIVEMALATEAKKFEAVKSDEKAFADAKKKVAQKLFSQSSWKGLSPSEAEWERLLERKVLAKQFVKFRNESTVVPISDGEAKRYFEENRAKFGGLSFEAAKESVKAQTARSNMDRRLKDWYEVLKAKYKAKNYLSEL